MRIDPRSTGILGIAFLIGLLAQFSVNVVGSLPLAEVVLLALAGVLLVMTCVTRRITAPFFREPLFWIFIATQAVALTSYIVSDLYRGTSTNDILRGWSRMVFLTMDIAMLSYLYGAESRSFLATQFGGALGGLVAVQVYGAQYDAFWKFGYGGPITFLIFLIVPRFSFWLGLLAIFGIGLVHLALDFRSFGAVCLLAGVLLCVTRLPRRLRVVTVLPALLAAIALAFAFYQSRGHDESGRGERSNVERTAMLAAAWEGVRESPWIGQGSWFSKSRVMENFLLLRAVGAAEAGVHGYALENEGKEVAIHSQILVSVAEGGILGGTFFFVFALALAWGLIHCVLWRASDVNTPVYLLALLLSVWNLLFSPFSGTHRLLIGFSCGLLIILWREARGKEAREPIPAAIPDEPQLSPAHLS